MINQPFCKKKKTFQKHPKECWRIFTLRGIFIDPTSMSQLITSMMPISYVKGTSLLCTRERSAGKKIDVYLVCIPLTDLRVQLSLGVCRSVHHGFHAFAFIPFIGGGRANERKNPLHGFLNSRGICNGHYEGFRMDLFSMVLEIHTD